MEVKMKIAFSTLGCPEWTWEEIIAAARDLGYDGVEVRGVEGEMYVPSARPFTGSNAEKTKLRLKSLGLEIPCLTSSCYLFEADDRNAIKEGTDYILLAEELGVPYVRVLGDRDPAPGTGIDDNIVSDNLARLAEFAGQHGVTVLIETNGVYSDSGRLAALIEKTGHPNAQVLWDIHHPYRFAGEPVEKTYETLKNHIRMVHIKDSVMEQGKLKYKITGQGDVPVRVALKLLKSSGYTGYVSLEWVKRWNMELEDPGIVIPNFINFVKTVV